MTTASDFVRGPGAKVDTTVPIFGRPICAQPNGCYGTFSDDIPSFVSFEMPRTDFEIQSELVQCPVIIYDVTVT